MLLAKQHRTPSIPKAFAAAVIIGALSAGATHAQITGQLYENTGSSPWAPSSLGGDGADANAPIPGGVTPNATFTVPNGSIDFDSDNDPVNGYTVNGFLATGGATILTGSSDSDNLNDTIITMSGNVTMVNGQVYETEHDDGLEITINGDNVVNEPGPTSASSTPFTWTGADGNYPFVLEYSEVNGPPAVLQTDLPLSAPDASTTMGLLGISLGALGAIGRRIKK
jgi:hypothetical protein